MITPKLDHCVITVFDWERSNRFYQTVLGAELVPMKAGWAYRFGATQLNVHGPGNAGEPNARIPVPAGGSDLCFEWPGPIEDAAAHLRAHGVTIEVGPAARTGARGRGTSVYFRDPDGSLLEFISYHRAEIAPYDRIADRWVQFRPPLRTEEAGLIDRLLAGLSAGAAVLDLGCGTGRPIAELLVARGCRVTGVDHSAAMLAKARAFVPGARLRQAELDAPLGETFAAAVCWDAIFHLARARHAAVFAEVARCLPPGGGFLFTTGGSANAPFTDTMFGQEFDYDAPAPAESVALVQAAGFRVREEVMLDPPRGGREKGRLAILAEKV